MLYWRKDLVTWQAMVGRHILEDIVGRVAQYVDEHYPVDKWHLGDLISTIGVKISSTYCELSKCLEGPLKMIVCPKNFTPCENCCMPLDNKCRIGPLAGAPPDTCAVVISTENRDSSLKLKLPEKNPVDTAYDVGSVVSVLADVGSSKQLRSVLLMVSLELDVWKEVSGVESMLATLLVPKWPLF
ncbi:hypothetical protein TNCV_1102771 [Trichonephila clavipes]|nr:hypothetical protein TNCV_1102771 [Trichonephila clavipes]